MIVQFDVDDYKVTSLLGATSKEKTVTESSVGNLRVKTQSIEL